MKKLVLTTTTTARSSSSTANNANIPVNCLEHHLQVYQNVIDAAEEKQIVDFLNPVLARRRYEGNHWDDVITKYKEIDLAKYPIPDQIQSIFDKIRNHIRKEVSFEKEFLTPHVIDLSKDGHIGGHVDSVKFSGDFICGLSLLSSRVMRLTVDWQDTPESVIRCSVKHEELVPLQEGSNDKFPPQVDLLLPRCSLYIMKGVWRYHYNHSVLGCNSSNSNSDSNSNSEPCDDKNSAVLDRRVSIIFRDSLDSKQINSSQRY